MFHPILHPDLKSGYEAHTHYIWSPKMLRLERHDTRQAIFIRMIVHAIAALTQASWSIGALQAKLSPDVVGRRQIWNGFGLEWICRALVRILFEDLSKYSFLQNHFSTVSKQASTLR